MRLNQKDIARLGVTCSPAIEEMNQRQDDILAAARAKLDEITNSTSAPKAAKIEAEFDTLMTEFDNIDGRATRHQRLEIRAALDRAPDPRRPRGVDGSVRADGLTIPPEIPTFALQREERMADWLRDRDPNAGHEFADLTIGAYLRAMVLGGRTETEKRALAEGTDSAGGYMVPEVLSASLIDRLRASSTVFRAGAQTVPLSSDVNHIAKVATDPAPVWRVENAAVTESDPTFTRVTFEPKSLAVLVRASRELIEDTLNVGTALPDLVATALAQELDRVALLGSGTPPEPEGVVNFSGLTANGFGGGALTGYGPLITARTALREANADVTAFVMSARDEGTFAGLTATDNQPMQVPPAIADIPRLATTKMPTDGGAASPPVESSIIAGDWRRLMIGVRSEIRIEVLKERYADQLQFGFLAWLRADVAAEHEGAFTVLDAITP